MKEKIVVFVCDTDIKGEKKLKQSTISFSRRQNDGEGGGDTASNNLGGDLGENLGSLNTSSVGEISGPTMEKGSMKNDETGPV